MLNGAPQMSPRNKIARRSQGVLKVMHVMFISWNGLVLDHPVPVGTSVNDPYYCSLLQNEVRPALRRKQPALLERGAILLQDNATPHHHRDAQNLVQRWGWEVLHILPTLQISPQWLLVVFTVKKHLRGKWFDSEDDINTAVIASLKRPSKDEYKAATDRLPRRWEKCVDSAGD
jgi:hypothetical protein